MTKKVIPFGVSCVVVTKSIPTTPTFDATKTQSPVWTEPGDGTGKKGQMDWYEDTDDTNDVPPEEPESK